MVGQSFCFLPLRTYSSTTHQQLSITFPYQSSLVCSCFWYLFKRVLCLPKHAYYPSSLQRSHCFEDRTWVRVQFNKSSTHTPPLHSYVMSHSTCCHLLVSILCFVPHPITCSHPHYIVSCYETREIILRLLASAGSVLKPHYTKLEHKRHYSDSSLYECVIRWAR